MALTVQQYRRMRRILLNVVKTYRHGSEAFGLPFGPYHDEIKPAQLALATLRAAFTGRGEE